MTLDHISVTNFKNIASAQLDFSPKVNCFLGNNGMGKSNLLDAIYYMSFCKSFSGATDAMLMRRGEEFAMIQARYSRRGAEEELHMGMSPGRRKSFKRSGKEYQRLSAHIGAFPLVMVSPQDIDLIRGESESRRRFMDMVISQGDPAYLDALIRYNRALEQRNRLLRDGVVDPMLYTAVETMMDISATLIFSRRREWVTRLSGIFARYYAAIAGSYEEVALGYRSGSADATMTQMLDSARRRDEIVRHTTVGPHRDDIEMTLDGMPMRRTGSQGQCKTYVIALRLAQYDFIKETCSMKPLLLLDDIFDKLDATRVERLVEMVSEDIFGQIFITDTNRAHLDSIVRRTSGDYRMWHVADGSFSPVDTSL